MADNVQDSTFEILKRLQESIAEIRTDMSEGFDRFAAPGLGATSTS